MDNCASCGMGRRAPSSCPAGCGENRTLFAPPPCRCRRASSSGFAAEEKHTLLSSSVSYRAPNLHDLLTAQ